MSWRWCGYSGSAAPRSCRCWSAWRSSAGPTGARDIVMANTAPSWKGLPTLAAILIAVSIWATVAWYWARVTVQYAPAQSAAAASLHQRWHGRLACKLQAPASGTAAMLSVALTLWQGPQTLCQCRRRTIIEPVALPTASGCLYPRHCRRCLHRGEQSRSHCAMAGQAKRLVGPQWLPDRSLAPE